jgi:hypothetical protein
MPVAIPERRVVEIWQSAIQQRKDLKTTNGGPVRIIYPGRPNDGRGADLKDAVIETGQGLYKGDIEVHVKSSAWKEHGHHTDPAYNQVILHVVYEHDAGEKARLQNGLEIPTLPLDSFAQQQAGQRLTAVFTPDRQMPCHTNPEFLTGVLERAGEARFQIKVREYEESLMKEGAGQTLYRGIMTALGYSKNQRTMAGLAGAIPLQELEAIINTAIEDNTCLMRLQARLVGGAGLLPSQYPVKGPITDHMMELERIWAQSKMKAGMSSGDWEFFKVRPGNYPDRRLMGMGVLLTRMRKKGLLNELEDMLISNSATGRWRAIEEALTVEDNWGMDTETGSTATLIGKERAGEIIVNAVLPFFTAYGLNAGRQELRAAAIDIYRQYPAGAENSVEKHMRKQLGIALKTAATALCRQGLLHIYKTFCTQGKCNVCALNRDHA